MWRSKKERNSIHIIKRTILPSHKGRHVQKTSRTTRRNRKTNTRTMAADLEPCCCYYSYSYCYCYDEIKRHRLNQTEIQCASIYETFEKEPCWKITYTHTSTTRRWKFNSSLSSFWLNKIERKKEALWCYIGLFHIPWMSEYSLYPPFNRLFLVKLNSNRWFSRLNKVQSCNCFRCFDLSRLCQLNLFLVFLNTGAFVNQHEFKPSNRLDALCVSKKNAVFLAI